LRINQRRGRVEIQRCLKINGYIFGGVFNGSNCPIDQTLFRISAIRDFARIESESVDENESRVLRVEGAVVDIKIMSAIVNVETLKNTQLVPRSSQGSIWDIILH
jgi:hypothetical protein